MFKRLVTTAASTITRASAILAGAAALTTSATTTAATPASTTPNVVFIMADDLGYTDVHCFGSQYYETPNIDRLAEQGMKLTSFHQAQNCQPTRAALMSVNGITAIELSGAAAEDDGVDEIGEGCSWATLTGAVNL